MALPPLKTSTTRSSRIQPLRLAFQRETRVLAVEYLDTKYQKKRFVQWTIPQSSWTSASEPEQLAKVVVADHPAYLASSLVSEDHLIQLFRNVKGTTSSVDLNKVSPDQLVKAKAEMNIHFEKNQVTRDSPNFVYDKRVEFDQGTQANDWDETGGETSQFDDGGDDSDGLQLLDDDDVDDDETPVISSPSPAGEAPVPDQSNESSIEEDLDLEFSAGDDDDDDDELMF